MPSQPLEFLFFLILRSFLLFLNEYYFLLVQFFLINVVSVIYIYIYIYIFCYCRLNRMCFVRSCDSRIKDTFVLVPDLYPTPPWVPETERTKGALAVVCTPTIKSVGRKHYAPPYRNTVIVMFWRRVTVFQRTSLWCSNHSCVQCVSVQMIRTYLTNLPE